MKTFVALFVPRILDVFVMNIAISLPEFVNLFADAMMIALAERFVKICCVLSAAEAIWVAKMIERVSTINVLIFVNLLLLVVQTQNAKWFYIKNNVFALRL